MNTVLDRKVIPYGRQLIDDDDIKEVIRALKSDFLTQGPEIAKFERAFANYVGSKFAVAVSNATAGLHLAVKSLGLRRGERVITTPITFAATANSIRYCGGEVWFADIDPGTYLLSIESTKKLIESKPKGFFEGIIPVDFAGLSVNLEVFKKLADEHDLWIIEDACHAPGGYFTDSKGQKNLCGNGLFSDCSVFSFHPVKHIACGEGGMVTTNSEELYKKIMLLRTHGMTKDNMEQNHGGWYYEINELGYNYRLTDIQSALGISQLAKNDKGVIRRNQIARNYERSLKGKVKYQELPKGVYNAHHLFVIEVEDRKGLYDYLRSNNIYSQIHYVPVHKLPYYRKESHGKYMDLTNSEIYYSKCLSLPMYPSLSDNEQIFVIEKVLDFIPWKQLD